VPGINLISLALTKFARWLCAHLPGFNPRQRLRIFTGFLLQIGFSRGYLQQKTGKYPQSLPGIKSRQMRAKPSGKLDKMRLIPGTD
jgi:hypothetical protein